MWRKWVSSTKDQPPKDTRPRGVRLAVLRDLQEEARVYRSRLGLDSDPLSTEVVYREIIHRATLAGKCSYLEVVSDVQKGPATVFASHAWSQSFDTLVSALALSCDADDYIYVTCVMLNPHKQKRKPPTVAQLEEKLRETIAAIPRTVLVLDRFDHEQLPLPLARSWVLYELYMAVGAGKRVEVAMPAAATAVLETQLAQDASWSKLIGAVSQIRLADAHASLGSDETGVRTTLILQRSLEVADAAVQQAVRDWLMRVALTLADSQPTNTPLNVNVANLLASKAALLASWRQDAEAESCFRSALACRLRALGDSHEDTLAATAALASILYGQGKSEQAEPLYQRALAGRERTLGAEHALSLKTAHELANVLSFSGMLAEAEALYRRVLAGREHTLGHGHPDTVHTLTNLGVLLADRGKPDEAEASLRQALELRERLVGAEHPDALSSLNSLANVVAEQGRLAEAEKLYRQALTGRGRALGLSHVETLGTAANLSLVLSAAGKRSEAASFARRALIGFEYVRGAEHLDTLGAVNNMAALLAADGKTEEAAALYRRALAGYGKALGSDNARTRAIAANLAALPAAR